MQNMAVNMRPIAAVVRDYDVRDGYSHNNFIRLVKNNSDELIEVHFLQIPYYP